MSCFLILFLLFKRELLIAKTSLSFQTYFQNMNILPIINRCTPGFIKLFIIHVQKSSKRTQCCELKTEYWFAVSKQTPDCVNNWRNGWIEANNVVFSLRECGYLCGVSNYYPYACINTEFKLWCHPIQGENDWIALPLPFIRYEALGNVKWMKWNNIFWWSLSWVEKCIW